MSSSILQQLGVNETFFVMLGVFLAFYILNNFISLKPLTNYLVERDHRMDGREEQIRDIREELSEIEVKLTKEMKQAQATASAKFSAYRSEAVESQRNILQHARTQASKDLNALKDKLQNDFESDLKKLEPQVDQFAQLIVDRFLATRASGVSVQTQQEV
jgi:F0F1-type ATP synthase membrane subunit b/b'